MKAALKGESPEGPSGDVRSLKYELSVHQEELKAQNEELRQAQLELSRARDRYKELFDSAPIGYLVLDGSRTIREANLTAASLLGTPRKDLIGTHLSKFMAREAADAYYLHLMEVRDRGTQQSRELVFRRPDGTAFHGHLETSPYEDSLFGKGWRIALVDITGRKQAEEALQEANKFLEQRVRERTMDLRKLASELVMAEERERKRIAGVLHDDIAQILAAVRMRLDALQDVPSDSKDTQTLTEAKSLLVRTIQETRGLMNDLGNPVLFDLGLQAACESLADRLMDKHSIRIQLRDTGCIQALESGRENSPVPGDSRVAGQYREAQPGTECPCHDRRGKRAFPLEGRRRWRGIRPAEARHAHRRRRVRALQHPGATDCRRRKPPDRIRPGDRHGGDGHCARSVGLIASHPQTGQGSPHGDAGELSDTIRRIAGSRIA